MHNTAVWKSLSFLIREMRFSCSAQWQTAGSFNAQTIYRHINNVLLVTPSSLCAYGHQNSSNKKKSLNSNQWRLCLVHFFSTSCVRKKKMVVAKLCWFSHLIGLARRHRKWFVCWADTETHCGWGKRNRTSTLKRRWKRCMCVCFVF